MFAYGGFLMLFGSLGGQFTLSKLSAAVYAATFCHRLSAILRTLHCLRRHNPGHDGARLARRQLFRRTTTAQANAFAQRGLHALRRNFFSGLPLDDVGRGELTWHDRLSRTHLSMAQTFADLENSGVAHSR